MNKPYIFNTSLLGLTIFLLVCCSPRATMKLSSNTRDSWDERKGYAIIPLEENPTINGVFLGELYVGDSGLSTRCDYTTILDILKEKAFAAGANLIKIKKVKKPDFMSSCYRFTADLFYSLEYKNYEKVIFWTEERKLAKPDFKAPSENRPHDSRSIHKIQYSWHRTDKARYWHIKFRASFDCESSYINNKKANELTLPSEHLLFDMTEKYARLMVEEMKNKGIRDLKTFNKDADKIMSDLSEKWDLERDKYLFEMQEDPAVFDKWRTKIDEDLQSLELLVKKRLLIKI
jgi:hypothetical protein